MLFTESKKYPEDSGDARWGLFRCDSIKTALIPRTLSRTQIGEQIILLLGCIGKVPGDNSV